MRLTIFPGPGGKPVKDNTMAMEICSGSLRPSYSAFAVTIKLLSPVPEGSSAETLCEKDQSDQLPSLSCIAVSSKLPNMGIVLNDRLTFFTG